MKLFREKTWDVALMQINKVRIATRHDEPGLINLLHLMHDESGFMPLNVDRARERFARAFDRKGGIIGIIGAPNVPEAAIGIDFGKMWYTDHDHIEEYFNYVHPDYRKSNHANSLIEFAKDCAVKIGTPLLIGVVTDKRMAPKVRLYRRRLGVPAGAFFVFNSVMKLPQTTEDFWSAIETRQEKRMRERLHTRNATPIVV